jgi:hypothetical protein
MHFRVLRSREAGLELSDFDQWMLKSVYIFP